MLSLWEGKDNAPLGPADTSTWRFHLVTTAPLDALGDIESLTPTRAHNMVDDGIALTCRLDGVRAAVHRLINDLRCASTEQ